MTRERTIQLHAASPSQALQRRESAPAAERASSAHSALPAASSSFDLSSLQLRRAAPAGGSVVQSATLQAKKILRHGQWVDVADNYELEPGESDEHGMRRRSRGTPAEAPPPSAPAEPGRPYWATHDAPTAHGPTPWLSAGLQFLTGSVDPAALANATQETRAHVARAAAEQKNGEVGNARISTMQASLAAAQAGTATPLAHHLIPLTGGGDAVWYAAKAAKSRLQKHKTKVKAE